MGQLHETYVRVICFWFPLPHPFLHIPVWHDVHGHSRRQWEVMGDDRSTLSELLAFELCFWNDKKKEARFPIMLSQRAVK